MLTLIGLFYTHVLVDLFSQQALTMRKNIITLLLHGSIIGAIMSLFGFKFALLMAGPHLLIDHLFWKRTRYEENFRMIALNQALQLAVTLLCFHISPLIAHQSTFLLFLGVLGCHLTALALVFLGWALFHNYEIIHKTCSSPTKSLQVAIFFSMSPLALLLVITGWPT